MEKSKQKLQQLVTEK